MNGYELVFFGGIAILFAVGIWAILSRRNLIKIIMGLVEVETAVNILLVTLGYVRERSAPITGGDTGVSSSPVGEVVDPIPQALVLTAIVIGLATTALALITAIGYYRKTGTLEIKSLTYGRTDEEVRK